MKLSIPRPKLNKADMILGAGATSLVVAVLFMLGVPGYRYFEAKTREATIRGNAATLQLAAETYAAANQGQYPTDVLDLVPYLPGDRAPLNPYTGKGAVFKGQPGDLTYRSPTNGRDYLIEAWGQGDREQPRRLVLLQGRRP